MSDKAHKQTDKRLEAMERRVREIYAQAEGDMRAKWEDFMEKAEKRTEQLRDKYEAALKNGDPKEIKEAKAALQQRLEYVTFRNEQYRDMVAEMAANYAHANEIALAYINGQLPNIYALNYNYAGGDIQAQVKPYIKGYSFTLVDRHTVKLLATKDKSLLPVKKVNVPKDKRWNTKQINAQVLQGILQGESMPKIAKRLQNVTDMTSAAAIRNARTMVTGAENIGRMNAAKDANAKGIVTQKRWLATHDERTRDWHMELNGVTIDEDKPFHNSYGDIMCPCDPAGHPANVYNCRCTTTRKVVGFRKKNGKGIVYIDDITDEDIEKTIASVTIKTMDGKQDLTKQGKSGIIYVKNAVGKKIKVVEHTSLNAEPNIITQKVSAKGGIERNYYGSNGRQYKQIANNDHGNPKKHPFGKNGEHAHDYVYNNNGELISRDRRELTDEERKENADIL